MLYMQTNKSPTALGTNDSPNTDYELCKELQTTKHTNLLEKNVLTTRAHWVKEAQVQTLALNVE